MSGSGGRCAVASSGADTRPAFRLVEGCRVVKKLIALVLAVAGGLAVWRRFQQDRAERDLWTEATSASSRG